MPALRDVARAAADAVAPAAEWGWARALRLARPILGGGALGTFAYDVGSVAIVAPHPDDETIGAGGVAALHHRAGAAVSVIVVTNGGASRASGVSPREMVSRRRDELETATASLGLSPPVTLDLPERAADSPAARDRLRELVADAEVVYAPSGVDFHPDHLDVAHALADVLRDDQFVRVYELGVPLTPILTNAHADIADVADVKRAALAAYESQAHALRPLRRLARYRLAVYGSATIEVFWEMTAARYRRLMRACPWTWDTSPFRGIRPWPLTDPLSFAVGWRTRRRLARLVDSAD